MPNNVNLNSADIHRKTVLHYAIEENDFEKVKQLVEAGINIKKQSNDIQDYFELAIQTNLEIADYLYTKEAYCAETPLCLAKKTDCYEWFSDRIRENLYASYP